MPLSWKDYVRIRRLDLESYCKKRKITNYEQFVSFLNKGDCVLPQEKEVEHFFVSSNPKIQLQESEPSVLDSVEVEKIEPEPEPEPAPEPEPEPEPEPAPEPEPEPEPEPAPKPKRKYTRRKKTAEKSQKTDISKRKPRRKKSTKAEEKGDV